MQNNAFVHHFFAGELFQSCQKRHCIRTEMRLHIAYHHIFAVSLRLLGGFQHGIGFAYAGGVTEKDFQFPMGDTVLFILYGTQQLLGIRPVFLHCLLTLFLVRIFIWIVSYVIYHNTNCLSMT